jgi:hypothetical protein
MHIVLFETPVRTMKNWSSWARDCSVQHGFKSPISRYISCYDTVLWYVYEIIINYHFRRRISLSLRGTKFFNILWHVDPMLGNDSVNKPATNMLSTIQ